jgi:ribosomal protein L11 methyltransferase
VVGEELAICFVWSEHVRPGRCPVVELDPDGGFGSGQHPATRLLLELLVSRLRGGERVLDVGCGSGVLGLSGLRLGASTVLGADIEESAVEATRRNAELNGLDRRVEAMCVPLDEVDGTFDVVLANIGRAALVELAPHLVRLLAPTGWVAVSGIAPSQRSLAAAVLRPLCVVEARTTGDWLALVLAQRDPGG